MAMSSQPFFVGLTCLREREHLFDNGSYSPRIDQLTNTYELSAIGLDNEHGCTYAIGSSLLR